MNDYKKEQDKATARPWKLISYETTGTAVWSDDGKYIIGYDDITQGFHILKGEELERFNDDGYPFDDYETFQNVKTVAEGDGTEGGTFLTAVKSHDALVEALEQLISRLEHHGNIDSIREEGPIEDAKTALRLAKGEA